MDNLSARARAWLEQDRDPQTREELATLLETGNDTELSQRFSGRLEFGTAGIRGILGAGPMRMNLVVVAQVSAGLADYVADTVVDARRRGVVIGHDARIKSREFAEEAAQIFLGKGFHIYLFEKPVPTPTTAFAVLDRNAAAGIMVTASHNPPDYNGYKVYWENGAQIIPPHDARIHERIVAVDNVSTLSRPALDHPSSVELLETLDDTMEKKYMESVLRLRLDSDAPSRGPLTIAYTPLHGVGSRFVEEVLRRAGHARLEVEPSQQQPDGTFPTVDFPNPEEAGAMDRVLDLAQRIEADLVLANDPDTDRLAVALPTDDGFKMLTGDQVGVLLADYLLRSGEHDRRLVATTVVSSQLLGVMAEKLGVEFRQTLTGFKWIANTAIEHKEECGSRFVMGYEEALGYTIGELVRDKDGVSAALLFSELVSVEKSRGGTILQRLEAIYREFGLYLTRQISLTLPGSEGQARIRQLMASQRAQPPNQIGDHAVIEVSDLDDVEDGKPRANVLVFRLEGGGRVLLRPSGTEPKLKSYYEVREPIAEGEDIDEAIRRADRRIDGLAAAHQAILEKAS